MTMQYTRMEIYYRNEIQFQNLVFHDLLSGNTFIIVGADKPPKTQYEDKKCIFTLKIRVIIIIN